MRRTDLIRFVMLVSTKRNCISVGLRYHALTNGTRFQKPVYKKDRSGQSLIRSPGCFKKWTVIYFLLSYIVKFNEKIILHYVSERKDIYFQLGYKEYKFEFLCENIKTKVNLSVIVLVQFYQLKQ